jgi:hypothetical protein
MACVNFDLFAGLLDLAVGSLTDVADRDWAVLAGDSEWSCWQTIDHVIDCVFSYGLQIGSQTRGGFLPFNELHALPSATPADLVAGLRGVGALFLGVVRHAPLHTVASDGVALLNLSDWCARAGYELALHTHDVVRSFGHQLAVPATTAQAISDSPALWFFDRKAADSSSEPWQALLLGSGRKI